ncbi:MAG: hypothetical protein WDN45_12630 [Caulobacteraceae bacterium]
MDRRRPDGGLRLSRFLCPWRRPDRPVSRTVLLILSVNLALILLLFASAARRVLQLVFEQGRNAGARLHLRFVTLFSLVAVVPAIVVAVVFGALVTRALDSWFSERVQSVIDNSVKIDKSYYDDQLAFLQRHVTAMASDVNDAAPTLKAAPIRFSQALAQLAAYHEFAAVYLIDGEGRILARAENTAAPAFVMPPPATLKAAAREITGAPFEAQDLFRAVYRLRAYPDAYLYVSRFVQPGMLVQLRRATSSLADYRDAEASPPQHRRGLRPQLRRDHASDPGGRRVAGHGCRQQYFGPRRAARACCRPGRGR